jgi:hypothetical protein
MEGCMMSFLLVAEGTCWMVQDPPWMINAELPQYGVLGWNHAVMSYSGEFDGWNIFETCGKICGVWAKCEVS